MPRIDIHTVLGFMPPCKKHELIVITRGATASIDYNLFDKVYDMENIDQLTFIFEQNKNIYSYNLIDYFKVTADESVLADKIYYKKVEADLASEFEFTFEPITTVTGNLISAYIREYGEIYEACDLASGEINTNWQFNRHFSYNHGKDYSYINFMLTSAETMQFKPTQPENNIQFEVAVRLNTDDLTGMHGEDSVIVTPQHPIAVIDSLYSKIAEDSGIVTENTSSVVSEKTYCSDSLYCKN